MASNFTTGIPEIDRLTGNKIGNGSFLLLSGNDDEGIAAFSAEIEKSHGRTADKEISEKNGCVFLKITPENRHCWKEICSRIFESKKIQIKPTAFEPNHPASRNKQKDIAERALERIIFIDSLTELFQTANPGKRCAVHYESCRLISYIKELKDAVSSQNEELTICGSQS